MLTAKMRRVDRQINDQQEIEQILQVGRLGHLAMAADDQPYVVPMTYLFTGSRIVFHGALEGQKARLLARNPSVCFEVSEFGEWIPADKPAYQGLTFRSVMVFGTVHEVHDIDRKIDIMHGFLDKYTGHAARWQITSDDVVNVMVLELEIGRLTGKRRRPFLRGDRVRLRSPELRTGDSRQPPASLESVAVYTVADIDERDWVRLEESPHWYSWNLFERVIR